MDKTTLFVGDSFEVLKTIPENSIDAVVTDPPYGWRFMGKAWDGEDIERMTRERMAQAQTLGKGGVERQIPRCSLSESAGKYDQSLNGNHTFQEWTYLWAREVFRVLKPGAHMLVFCGPRTYHRMASGVEDAGFEIRDMLAWLFASGFPKSLNVNKVCNAKGWICECEQVAKHDVRSMQHTNVSAKIDASKECPEILQHGLPEQNISECRSEGSTALQREESLLARGQLHRASEGVSNDPQSRASEGAEERICARAHFNSGKDIGASTKAQGSSSPYQSQSCGQSPREPESLRGSQRALDGAPFPRCPKCEKPILPEGTGTALKPAHEGIVLARKPLSEKTVAENVLKWGVGGLNIDGCRIPGAIPVVPQPSFNTTGEIYNMKTGVGRNGDMSRAEGRFPANLILDETAAEMLDEQSGLLQSRPNKNPRPKGKYAFVEQKEDNLHRQQYETEKGGASRFFYVAKSSKSERNRGLEARASEVVSDGREKPIDNPFLRGETPRLNTHPTVKPIKLMRYLCRLITPPGGTVLDPFMGSGSTGIAAREENFKFIGIEIEEQYYEIARMRIEGKP